MGFDAFKDYLVSGRQGVPSRRLLSPDAATDYRSRLRRIQQLLGVRIENASPLFLRALTDGLRRDPRVVPLVQAKVIGDIAVALRAYAGFVEQQLAASLNADAGPVACLDARAVGAALRRIGFTPQLASTRRAIRMHRDGVTMYVVPGLRTPLIVHPAMEAIYTELGKRSDVIAVPPLKFYHHAGLDGFPEPAGDDGTTKFGIPLGFLSTQGLENAVELMQRTGQQIVDDGHWDWQEATGSTPTSVPVLQNARRGQGRFRADLLDLWQGTCALTGVANPDLLRASHIKAWRDSSDRERLDMFNGLLLAVHLDALFDRLLISFDEDGSLLLSRALQPRDRRVFGLDADLPKLPLSDAHLGYISHHRGRFQGQEAALL